MNTIQCELCDYLIDSDDDPECFVEQFWTADGDEDAVLCVTCRGAHLEWLHENVADG